jgi:hypothetical protein
MSINEESRGKNSASSGLNGLLPENSVFCWTVLRFSIFFVSISLESSYWMFEKLESTPSPPSGLFVAA